jgi:hypothetical protein
MQAKTFWKNPYNQKMAEIETVYYNTKEQTCTPRETVE